MLLDVALRLYGLVKWVALLVLLDVALRLYGLVKWVALLELAGGGAPGRSCLWLS